MNAFGPTGRAIAASWRSAIMTSLAYRVNFLVDAVTTVLWVSWTVLPLLFVFHGRETVGGWTADEALLVTGFFVCLQGILEAVIDPNLRGLVEDVRNGTLDFVLLKPVDPQLLVSFRRLVPAKIVHALAGLGLVVWACTRLPAGPTVMGALAAAVLLIFAVVILYSVWLLVISTAFWFVRVDNLSYLLGSALDAGRWPVQIYRPALRLVFTFLFPIGLMTTWPAMALRGLLDLESVGLALVVTVIFAWLGRRVWVFALRHYASASS